MTGSDRRRLDAGVVLVVVLLALAAIPAHGRPGPTPAPAGGGDRTAIGDAELGPTGAGAGSTATTGAGSRSAHPGGPDLLDRVEALTHAELAPRVVPQSHPGVEVTEPYFGAVGEVEVRAASAVTGEPIGLYLDDDDARARVEAARSEIEIVLAVAGVAPHDRLSDDLRSAARALGVADGDDGPSRETVAALRAVVVDRVSVPLRLVGVEPQGVLGVDDLRRGLSAIGHDPGDRVDPDDVVALEYAAAGRAAPLIHASGRHPGARLDPADLEAMVRAVGHDAGSTVDAGDVAAALARSRTLHRGAASAISPGLTYQRVVADQPGGAAVGHLLQWRLDDERVTVRTEQTGDFTGRVSVPAMAAARPTAVAAVNGGFWIGAADPDGLLVTDGQLLSDPTMRDTWLRGRRGGFALLDGGAVVGAPDWGASITGGDPAAGVLAVRGVNRPLGAEDLVVFTDRWGATTGTAWDTIEVTVAATSPLSRSGVATGTVVAVGANGNAPVPPGATVVAATGRWRDRLLLMAASGTIHLHVDVPEQWAQARQGLTGGPLMLQHGQPTTTEDWRSEGFAASHTDRRHPRTVVGFDGFGNGYVLVIDGRQPGYSVGATHPEATLLARALGMTDAVMMDGGGSSQLVVSGAMANRPCCDPAPRPVATAITFHAP